MTDKQFLQRMKKMVKQTHWIKRSLERALEWEKDPDRPGYCKLDDEGELIPGKMGNCIMGMVAVVGGIEIKYMPNTNEQTTEYLVTQQPQTLRITERLFKNLPDDWQYSLPDDSTVPTTVLKAYRNESYNDSNNTQKSDILDWLDRAIASK